jgi:hypothetical protein
VTPFLQQKNCRNSRNHRNHQTHDNRHNPNYEPAFKWFERERKGGSGESNNNQQNGEKKDLHHGQHKKESGGDLPRRPPFRGIFVLGWVCRFYEPNHNICFMTFACNLKVILRKFPT